MPITDKRSCEDVKKPLTAEVIRITPPPQPKQDIIISAQPSQQLKRGEIISVQPSQQLKRGEIIGVKIQPPIKELTRFNESLIKYILLLI